MIRELIINGNYENLKNHFSGRECFIIACGPSLSRCDFNFIKSRSKDKIVFCIKQSYLFFEDICDIHFNNFCNFQKYTLRDSVASCVVWWSNNQKKHKNTFERADLLFKVDPQRTLTKMSKLVNQKGFENLFVLNNNLNVCKGPGIMYECVLPLAIYMGFNKITTFGWDIGNNKNNNQHFYNDDSSITDSINYKAGSFNGETDMILSVIPQVSEILSKSDIKVQVVSDINPIDQNESFSKITFEKWIENEK